MKGALILSALLGVGLALPVAGPIRSSSIVKRSEDDPLIGADVVWKKRSEDDPLIGADVVWKKRSEDDPLIGADVVWKKRSEDDPLIGADVVWKRAVLDRFLGQPGTWLVEPEKE